MQVAVHVDGVLNDPAVIDTGWAAEVTLPWLLFLGRFQRFATRTPGETMAAGWAANAHGVNDTHLPERFTQVTFSG